MVIQFLFSSFCLFNFLSFYLFIFLCFYVFNFLFFCLQCFDVVPVPNSGSTGTSNDLFPVNTANTMSTSSSARTYGAESDRVRARVLYDCCKNLDSRISSCKNGDASDGENGADNYYNNNNNSNSRSSSDERSANDMKDLHCNSIIRSDSNSNSNSNGNSCNNSIRSDSGAQRAVNSVDGGGSQTSKMSYSKESEEIAAVDTQNSKKQKLIYDGQNEIHAKDPIKSQRKSKIVSISSCFSVFAFLEKIE
jgi:hypothetical protein